METLHDDRLANIGFGDNQLVDVEVMVVLGVCNRGFERLLDGRCDTLAGEFQVSESALYLLAADQRGNQVELLRADAQRTCYGLRLIVLEPAFGFCLANDYFLFAFLSAP